MTHRDEYVEFVTPRLGRLRALAYQLSGDWHGADDLVQITLTKTLLNWRRVREATDIDMYVRAILVKAFLTERTLGWSRVRLLAAIPERPAPPRDGVEDRALVRAALARLPQRQRAVVVLRFLCDLSVAETAEILDCSPGTVKSQTHHALVALRGVLGEHAITVTGKELT
jgi:RNA polymerase sigma-70 factor (sigma-E family)